MKLTVSTAEFRRRRRPDKSDCYYDDHCDGLTGSWGSNGGQLTEAVTVSVEVPDGGTFYTIEGAGGTTVTDRKFEITINANSPMKVRARSK